jgi:hypothetical protein
MPNKFMSRKVKCPHCGNTAPMDILEKAHATQSFQDGDDEWHKIEWEAGHIYWLLQCLSCSNIVLDRQAVHTGIDPEGIEGPFDILYPPPIEQPSGLPPNIAKAYDAALAVKHINSNIFAVVLGRVLEMACNDQGAKDKFLHDKINDLIAHGKLPESMANIAHALKNLRNIGAHAGPGELGEADAPLLESLCHVVLVYLYTAPALVGVAKKRIDELSASPSQSDVPAC